MVLLAVLVLLRAAPLVAPMLLRVIQLVSVAVITVALPDALVLPRMAPALPLSHAMRPVVLLAVALWTPMQMYWWLR